MKAWFLERRIFSWLAAYLFRYRSIFILASVFALHALIFFYLFRATLFQTKEVRSQPKVKSQPIMTVTMLKQPISNLQIRTAELPAANR